MQLNNALLEQRIIKELEENPTLEIMDPESPEESEELEQEVEESEFDWEELDSDVDRFELKTGPSNSSRDFLFTNHAPPKSLSDRINQQLIDINISDDKMIIAHEISGNLDEDGYFKVEPILIADKLDKNEDEVLEILKIIQGLEPAGIASRDLRECLMNQIKDDSSLEFSLLDRCFEDFTKKRYEKICEKLSCDMENLKDAIDAIKRLNPKPRDDSSLIESEIISPDLIMEKRSDQWVIHMNDNSMYELQVNSNYKQMLDSDTKDKKALKFIREKLSAAEWFIDAINQRKRTILSVMNIIVKKQKNIFEDDEQQLQPMILKDIADELGMDISTISRVTNGKYVQLPWGILELKNFFSESIKTSSGDEISNTVVKNKIKDIIKEEDKAAPLDDQAITDMLTNKGYLIARRTVAKYRNSMGIAKSKLRREIVDE